MGIQTASQHLKNRIEGCTDLHRFIPTGKIIGVIHKNHLISDIYIDIYNQKALYQLWIDVNKSVLPHYHPQQEKGFRSFLYVDRISACGHEVTNRSYG